MASLGSYKNFLYKAYGTQGAAILIPREFHGKVSSVKYVGTDGRVIDTSYIGGNWQETGADKYNLGSAPEGLPPGKVVVTLDDGSVLEQEIADPKMDFRQGSPTPPQNMNSGPGAGAGSQSGVPGQFQPGSIGFGSVPAYLGNQYPSPVFSQFQPTKAPNIKTAPYNYIDPAAFATSFGAVNRAQYVENASLSKDIALDQLDTELRGLQGYAPAAAALKRGETDIDNQFNQFQRNRQIASELPNARADLEAQRRRANIYAEGRVPDEITDRSLELGVRSAAADNASAGGFGTGSVAAANLSNTMSAKERLAIAAQGENLLSGNLKDSSQLLLAPLEYSNAGSQINVMPSLSGSQLASNALRDINALTTIDPATALNTAVNQQQFGTNLEQRNREFNASNKLSTNQFNATGMYNASANNASIANNFALGKFAYDVNYAGAAAGAAQLNTNTGLALAQQQQYQNVFSQMMNSAQSAQQKAAIAQGIAAAIPTIIAALSGTKGTATPTTGGTTTGGVSGGGGGSSSGGVQAPTLTPGTAGGNVEAPPGTVTDADGSIILPNGSPMPEGFHGGQTVDGGQVIVPNSDAGSGPTLPSEPEGFHYEPNDTGDDFVLVPDEPPQSNPDITAMEDDGIDTSTFTRAQVRQFKTQAASVNATMGISAKPIEGSVLTGYDKQGKAVYSNQAALRSQDTSTGARTTNTLQEILAPLGVFKDKRDATALQQISSAASDVSFAAKLTDLYQKGDRAGFANAILSKFGGSTLTALGVDKKTVQGAGALFNAYNLYNNWGNLSPAQKSMGLASVGIQGFKTVSGTDLASTPIIKASEGNPGLNVGQALNFFQAGYNVYSLVDNWNQLNTIQKITAGTGTAAQLAQVAQSLNLISSGASAGAAGASAAGATAAGASAGSAGAAGASAGTVGASAGTSAGASAGTSGGATVAGSVAAGAAVAAGAYQVSQAYGQGGAEGRKAGAMGAATMVAGLAYLTAWNPVLFAAVMAVGVIAGSIKKGKHADQTDRDMVRGNLQKSGITDGNNQITLASGKKVDIGADGHSGTHAVKDISRMPESVKKLMTEKDGKLHSYDTDITNDLDYVAGAGGIAFSRLVNGGKNKSIDQMGSQIGNATLDDIGYGKEFTQSNFNKLMQNQRALYSQSGIKNKSDAYAIADAAFKAGKIDATDLVTMHQTFNMMYDPSPQAYATAQKLMTGRFNGIDVAAKDQAPVSDVPDISAPVNVGLSRPGSVSSASTPVPRGGMRTLSTKAEIAERNRNRFGSPNQAGAF